MNLLRTAVLMAFLTGLFIAIGYLLGGQSGMVIAFLFALGMNLFAYWNSDKMVLRMYNAREVDEQTAPELVHLVHRLAQNAGLPLPKVYIADNPQPNAFATGRDPEHAAVCATTGLLERLSEEELAGVLAHELSHVKNRDTLIMTVTATIAGAISMLANFAFMFGGGSDRRNNPLGPLGAILIMIVAPIAAMLVQMAISRTREYEADRSGAQLSGRPLWLASALRRTCSSSIPCIAAGSAVSSRPIRRPRSASQGSRPWRPKWARSRSGDRGGSLILTEALDPSRPATEWWSNERLTRNVPSGSWPRVAPGGGRHSLSSAAPQTSARPSRRGNSRGIFARAARLGLCPRDCRGKLAPIRTIGGADTRLRAQNAAAAQSGSDAGNPDRRCGRAVVLARARPCRRRCRQ